jgi:hypothetical protein
VSVRLVPREALPGRDAERMRGLLAAHFEGVSRDAFEADLAAKNWVLLLEGDGGALEGFTTLHFERLPAAGESAGVIYSGDTIIEPAAWGRMRLAPAWIGAVNRLRREAGVERLHWLLIVSGFRTYRFLPTFWRDFYPRRDRATPPEARALLDDLAARRFSDRYDRAAGVVRLAQAQLLRPHLAGVPEGRADDPDVAFFLQRNPGHSRGDELVCLAELSEANLTPAGRRMWRQGERLFPPTP